MEKIDRPPNPSISDTIEGIRDKLDEIVDWINEQGKLETEVLKDAINSAILALKDNDTPKAIEILGAWAKHRRP